MLILLEATDRDGNRLIQSEHAVERSIVRTDVQQTVAAVAGDFAQHLADIGGNSADAGLLGAALLYLWRFLADTLFFRRPAKDSRVSNVFCNMPRSFPLNDVDSLAAQ
jgi:hypothetical protein